MDDNRDKWLKAVKEHAMPWMHVSDLKGRETNPAKLYNVNGIPNNYLIDPNGIIIEIFEVKNFIKTRRSI